LCSPDTEIDVPGAADEDNKHVERLLREMTLDEKISQLSSSSPAVERLGIGAFNWWAGAHSSLSFASAPPSLSADIRKLFRHVL